MQKSEEHTRRGFELLSTRQGLENFFDALADAGLFNSQQHSGPIPGDDPNYVRIPYWSALDYLEAVSKLAAERNDLDLANKVMGVVRDVSSAREADGSIRDNYHTWGKFAEIIGIVPTTALTLDDIELIPHWLESKYDRGIVVHALDQGVLKKLLAGDSPDDWSMACHVFRHCTAISWEKEKFAGGRKKPVSIVDDYWLKKMVEHHAQSFGIKTGMEAAQILRERVQEVYGGKSGKLPTYTTRPAVEKHEQNRDWKNGPENSFVEGLRDVLLAWVEHDAGATSKDFVAALLQDKNEMVRRIAIYVTGQCWQQLSNLYEEIISPKLLNSKNIHEMYQLLKDRFGEFPEPYKVATLAAIRDLPPPKDDENAEIQLKYTQKNWLSAIVGKGYEPADAWYRELSSDETLGELSSHPDFHFYMESWSGSGPSPFSAQELLAYAEDGSLIMKLNEFQPTKDWRGPSVRSLVQVLEEAVGINPKLFLHLLPEFHKASRPYQYGIISSFKHLWDTAEGNNKLVDWNAAWPKFFDFFDKLLVADFWSEEVVKDKDLTPTRDWIPSAIAEFIKTGTKKDEHAFSADLLPQSFSIIEILLEKTEPVQEASDDVMTQAINSEKGKSIEALINHALRACRVSDQLTGNHLEIWASMEHAFDREIIKCTGSNYEFSTLTATYLPNLEYMSSNWLRNNFSKIFPKDYPINFLCAIDGLTYCSATRSNYALLVEHGVLDQALKTELKGRQVRERIVERISLAYLWGDEQLDSPRFTYLFDSARVDDLKSAADFFRNVRGQELSAAQIKMVFDFWERCVEWVHTQPEIPKQLMSTLSRLACYVSTLTEKEIRLLMEVAPYASVGNNADHFIKELGRLVESYTSEVTKILRKMLETYKPTFDFEDRLKNLLVKLSEKGKREDALIYADRVRHLPGFIELYKQLG